MVLAVIFAQRWKVIDARAPAGPMSATSVVTTNSRCAKARVVGPCKRQALALAVRSEGTRPGRRSVGGNTRFPCRFTRHSLLKIPSRGLAGSRIARQEGLLDVGATRTSAWTLSKWPSLDTESDTSSQPHLNVRVCGICITPDTAPNVTRECRVQAGRPGRFERDAADALPALRRCECRYSSPMESASSLNATPRRQASLRDVFRVPEGGVGHPGPNRGRGRSLSKSPESWPRTTKGPPTAGSRRPIAMVSSQRSALMRTPSSVFPLAALECGHAAN